MIEILIIWQLCKSIGSIAAKKGRSVAGARWILIGLWLTGEMTFGLGGAIADLGAGAYLAAIVGAAVGAFSAFAIVKSWAPVASNSHTGGFPVITSQPVAPNFRQSEM